jgi:exopolysaccharide biosynthesis polyprenyl glycosylphosphotransferase
MKPTRRDYVSEASTIRDELLEIGDRLDTAANMIRQRQSNDATEAKAASPARTRERRDVKGAQTSPRVDRPKSAYTQASGQGWRVETVGAAAVALDFPPLQEFWSKLTRDGDERLGYLLRLRMAGRGGRRELVVRALAVSDAIALAAAGALAPLLLSRAISAGWLVIVIAIMFGWFALSAQRLNRQSDLVELVGLAELSEVAALVVLTSTVVSVAARLFGSPNAALKTTSVFVFAAIATVALGRVLARWWCHRQIEYLQNTVIVGAGVVGQSVAKRILQHPEYGLNLVGFVDAEPLERSYDLLNLTLLGTSDQLPDLVRLLDIERVVIAFSNDAHEDTLDLIRTISSMNVEMDIVPRLFEAVGAQATVHTVGGFPLVGLPPLKLTRPAFFLKRLMDVAIASLTLVLLAPLFAVVALLVKLESSGPVFFRQFRLSHDGRAFRLYKFRTMVSDTDPQALENLIHSPIETPLTLESDPRVTRIGRFLRRHSLDELPQLINVLKGDMSLVGPRSLSDPREVTESMIEHLNLKPGLTGNWRVAGHHQTAVDEANFAYDYMRNWSPSGDLGLLVRALSSVFGNPASSR